VNHVAPPLRIAARTTRGRFRGPFARWPRTADAVLGFVMFLVMAFLLDRPGDEFDIRPLGEATIPILLVSAASGAALYWRRRAPLAVAAVSIVAWGLTIGAGNRDFSGVATILALYSLGRYGTDIRGAVAGVASAIVMMVIDVVTDPDVSVQTTGVGAFVMFVSWYIGRRVRLRHERAEQELREQAAEARRILVEERARIARELHDVVAHRVSLMTVQAGAAKAVAAEDLDGALRAMGAVEDAGRQALTELRHLLGVLRPESDGDGLGPQPGLADLPRLADQIRGAGVGVSLAADGAPGALPARVDLFAYRIVQEALTNVLKHAGPGTKADVRLCTDRDRLVIEVINDGPAEDSLSGETRDRTGGGHGLVGMRERALLLGGTLDAGPRQDGGFAVRARLPMGGRAA
jgi:signal transduction histidine kinase